MKHTQENQIVRECIATALLQLMREKPFEAITVTELARRAGVSRTTYYRNFTSKEDILRASVDQIMDAFTKAAEALPPQAGVREVVRCAFSCGQAHSGTMQAIRRAGLDHLLRERFDAFIEELCRHLPILRSGAYPARMLSGALLSTLFYWYDTGMQESSSALADLFFLCMSGLREPDPAAQSTAGN